MVLIHTYKNIQRIVLWLCWFCIALLQAATAGPLQQRPNVLFLLADDLGWGDLSCYGNRKITTGNLDKLAASGMLYSQFYVSATVCSPSRAAFLTGRCPARDSIHGHLADHARNAARAMPDYLNPSLVTLPRLLQQQGYATAHFGKWHLGAGAAAPDLDRYGFDEYKMSGYNSDQPWELGDTSTQMDISSPAVRPVSSAKVADQVIGFIKRNSNRNQPFYINAWFLDVHATLNPSEQQVAAVKHLGIGNKVPFTSPAQVYYGTLLELDRQIGRILRALHEEGLADNTIIIFSSDNGPEDINVINAVHSGVGSAGPFRGRKRSLYEGGIRMPFIVSWPGHIPAGRTDDRSVLAGVDLLPTICRLTGVTVPAGTLQDGEDRSACWLGQPSPRTRPLFWEWRFNIPGHPIHKSPTLCIRRGKWKLLMNADTSRVELYDINNDPREMTNVAEKHPATVQRLMTALLQWKQSLPVSPPDNNAGRILFPWPGKGTGRTK